MRRQLGDRGVVIVGATSGIGRAVALQLAAAAAGGAGCAVAAGAGGSARGVRAEESWAIIVPLDVAGAASVEALADEADAWLEGIDTWINTAGVLVAGRLVDVPAEQIGRAVATNVIGMTLCSCAALARFEQRGSGVLINRSSVLVSSRTRMCPSTA